MPCTDYKPLLPKYVEGDLPAEQTALVRDHLPSCDSCRKTIRLLRLEDHAIQSALLGLPSQAERTSPARGLVRAAIICGILLGVILTGLYLLYASIRDRHAAQAGAATPQAIERALERGILVRAERMMLPDFLDRLSEQAKVPVVRDPKSPRPPPTTTVDLVLVRPVRLRSVLALLEEMYGLEHRVSEGRILVW